MATLKSNFFLLVLVLTWFTVVGGPSVINGQPDTTMNVSLDADVNILLDSSLEATLKTTQQVSSKPEPPFFRYVRQAILKGCVVLEQPYSVVDSFRLRWNFGNRDYPLPRKVGWVVNGRIMVDRALRKPWLTDREFMEKKEKNAWVEGRVPDTCRYRQIIGGPWRGGKVDSLDARFVEVIDDAVKAGFNNQRLNHSQDFKVAVLAVITTKSDSGSIDEGVLVHLYSFEADGASPPAFENQKLPILTAARFAISAKSGTIDLLLEGIGRQEFGVWRFFPINAPEPLEP
jgi:hypothetical protein